MKRNQIKVIKEILNSCYNRAVCNVCGNYQSHQKIYCDSCGGRFGVKVGTLLDALRAAHSRQLQDKKIMLRPDFFGAVYKRTLDEVNVSRKEFTNYVSKLL